MKIAHFSAEVSPFAKTGGLGDVVGALPLAQAQLGHSVSVWMPLYRQVRDEIRRRKIVLEQALEPFSIELGFQTHQIDLKKCLMPSSNVPIYFVGSDKYFDRPFLYYVDSNGRDDGLYRYSVFVRAALASVRRLQMVPDVFHAHDWHAALLPMALAWDSPRERAFADSISVFTIHNLAFQGVYDASEHLVMGLPREMLPAALWRERLNLVKGAVLSADVVTAVSPSFAREIATPDGGFDLDPLFRYRGDELVGIVNGIDDKVWNPALDIEIPRQFNRYNLSGKTEDRRVLLELAGMDPRDPGLVIGLVGRLTEQKGYDLVFAALDDLLKAGIRFVFLGAGEASWESLAHSYSKHAARKFWGYVGFDEKLAHLIEAGADAFLMPSRFEPCGLAQLYALAYGTVPIVRRVGGLIDTVIPFNGSNQSFATGFGFETGSREALLDTVLWANKIFHKPNIWIKLVRNGMAQDFSWQRSARTYVSLYKARLMRKREAHASRAFAAIANNPLGPFI